MDIENRLGAVDGGPLPTFGTVGGWSEARKQPGPGRLDGDRLPTGLAPRCLSIRQGAAYIGVGEEIFTAMVREGALPAGLKFRGRRVWDRVALDLALDRLSGLLVDEAPRGGSRAASLSKAALMEAINGSL